MTTIPPLFCHAQPPLQNNVHPCSCVVPSMHTKSMLVLFSSVSPSYFMSIYPFFVHFPHFHILILVIGHMITITPLFCHAQPPLQNNVHPCSSFIPSMHTKSMLVLFFIRFSLLFPVHLSFFYLFPSFPYFDLRYWPHDHYPSPLLPCTTSPSKQCSSMFICHSIHAHQKHVSFVFHPFLPPISCPSILFLSISLIVIFVIGHMTTIPPLFCHAQPTLFLHFVCTEDWNT